MWLVLVVVAERLYQSLSDRASTAVSCLKTIAMVTNVFHLDPSLCNIINK